MFVDVSEPDSQRVLILVLIWVTHTHTHVHTRARTEKRGRVMKVKGNPKAHTSNEHAAGNENFVLY